MPGVEGAKRVSPNIGPMDVQTVTDNSAFVPFTETGTVHSKGAHARSPSGLPLIETDV